MSKRSKQRSKRKQMARTTIIEGIGIHKRCATPGCDIWFAGKQEENYCQICIPADTQIPKQEPITSKMVDDFLDGVESLEGFWFIATCMLLVDRIWMFSNDMVKGVIPNDRVNVKEKIAYVDSFMAIQDTLQSLTNNFYLPNNIIIGMYKKIPVTRHTEIFDERIRNYYDAVGYNDRKGILMMLRPVVIRFSNIIKQYKSLAESPISIRWLYISEQIPSFLKAYLSGH